jgi:predicted lipoprotein with Yx(FWY)xxD motif
MGYAFGSNPYNHKRKVPMTYTPVSWKALLVAASLALPTLAAAADPAMTENGRLVDHHKMTLYTYDKDAMNKSTCNGECAENWPPLKVSMGDQAKGDWTTIKRDDGKMQWAYKGKPLYTYKDDKKAGDKMGDGKRDVWHIAKP